MIEVFITLMILYNLFFEYIKALHLLCLFYFCFFVGLPGLCSLNKFHFKDLVLEFNLNISDFKIAYRLLMFSLF